LRTGLYLRPKGNDLHNTWKDGNELAQVRHRIVLGGNDECADDDMNWGSFKLRLLHMSTFLELQDGVRGYKTYASMHILEMPCFVSPTPFPFRPVDFNFFYRFVISCPFAGAQARQTANLETSVSSTIFGWWTNTAKNRKPSGMSTCKAFNTQKHHQTSFIEAEVR
jgi:hypothetical protein